MSQRDLKIAAVGLFALAFSATVWAQRPDRPPRDNPQPIPDEKQAKLLETFGDEGIDANEDGVLTREEVREFFGMADAARRGHDGPGREHQRGDRGKGRRPRQDQRSMKLLDQLEKLSSEEMPTDLDAKEHPRMDADGNGEISQAEWQQFVKNMRPRLVKQAIRRFPKIDADSNGDISAEELAAFKSAQKARLDAGFLKKNPDADTDGDGKLSEEELKAFKEKQLEKRAARILQNHPEADTDGDGVLSNEEADAFRKTQMADRAAKMLEKHPEADLDGDGELSWDEIKEFHKDKGPAQHGKRRGGFRGERERGPREF